MTVWNGSLCRYLKVSSLAPIIGARLELSRGLGICLIKDDNAVFCEEIVLGVFDL